MIAIYFSQFVRFGLLIAPQNHDLLELLQEREPID